MFLPRKCPKIVGEVESTDQKLESAKPADVQEVKHGKWIKVPSATHKDLYWYDCSICKASCGERSYKGLFETIEWNGGITLYCPHCGAKMDGDEK